MAAFQPYDWLFELLTGRGIGPATARPLTHLSLLAAIAILCVAANFLLRHVILTAVKSIVGRTRTRYDDLLIQHHVFDRLSHVAPGLIVYGAAPLALPGLPVLQLLLQRLALAYLVIMGATVVSGFLNVVTAAYQTLAIARDRPIKAYVQIVKLFVYLIAIVFVVSTLGDRSPWVFLSGLGALTAVLVLIFKDTILGLVASIVLTSYDMVRIGDWIEMPKHGADGDVIDISLTVVKVQNWDKTITSIPAYELIASSFKNWRGMTESGGRRIKRAIHIDLGSIRFCTEEMLLRFRRMTLLRPYLEEKLEELRTYNAQNTQDLDDVVNGRRLTNVGTFRAYVVRYLRQHPAVNQDMTFLVRHLQPGESGLPLEVYVFCKDTRWAVYESVQADIFDHLLAVVPEFGLRVFQSPSGSDVTTAGQRLLERPS